jgi:Heavy-metal resistance
MGYAKAAELNGYPGPMHVLELAARLELSPAQRASVEAILREHKAEARQLGAEVIRLEAQLDDLFAKGQASAEGVDAAVGRLATTAGLLRASHLRAHVTTTRLLSPEQVTRYVALRGYAGAHGAH